MDAYNTYVRPNVECAQAFLWSPHTSPYAPSIINNINELEAQPATLAGSLCDARDDV